MVQPFFIAALPRSRTAWIANWLTHGRTFCHHDAWRWCERVSDMRLVLESHAIAGNADSQNGPRYEVLVAEFGHDVPFLVIERDIEDVFNSCLRMGLWDDADALWDVLIACENANKRIPKTAMRIAFDDMDNPIIMASVLEYLMPGQPFDYTRFSMLCGMKVEVVVSKYLTT